jgi:CheY-like chemotaxis protein
MVSTTEPARSLIPDAEDGQEALVKIQRAMASASASASASAPDAMDPKGEATDAADAESESEKADMRPKPYDAVLMDLEMPVMDGYTAAQRVRAAEDAGELDTSLVIALSE